MALDDATTRRLVHTFIVSRSSSGGATAKELAQILRVSQNHARALLENESKPILHEKRADAAHGGTARHRWFPIEPLPTQEIERTAREFAHLALIYRQSHAKAAVRPSETISQQLERAENALFRGDLEEAGRALNAIGRTHDRLSQEVRFVYSTRKSIANANAAMQAGQFEKAARIARQFMHHDLPLDRHLELRATYGAALRMNPSQLRKSVSIYTEGINLALAADGAGRARLRHLLTARSAPLAALGHAREAVADLNQAVHLAENDEHAHLESRLCRVRALFIAGDLRGAEHAWPDKLPAGVPLWLEKWHKRFRLAFLPETTGPDEWNASAMQVWSDNKDHGFQRKLIAAMVLRSPHARRDAWKRETWAELEQATRGVAPDSLFLAT